jgi:CheY-like chemotaxis protein
MIANCPQCAMSLTFDDERLPTEPFNVLCPRCRQTVTIMPPPKEEPRLPGTTGTLERDPELDAMATPVETDPVKALADMLLSGIKQSLPHAAEPKRWNRRRVVLCLDDANTRESVRRALDATRYEIFSADSSPEAVEILHESRAEAIVLSPNFDSGRQGGGAMMQYVNSLTPQLRRRTFVVLVSSQLRTMDTYLAFANGVNLTVHPEDVGTLQAIFERSVRDFNELYKPLNQATSTPPF